MIAVPFIYFSCLFIHTYYKKGFDLSAYLVLIYVIISFFSVLIDINGLRSFDTSYYEISLEPALVYCFLLTIIFVPFYIIDFNKIRDIKLIKPKVFDFIVYVYFISFLFLLFSSISGIIQILTGDLGALRAQIYKGESVSDVKLNKGVIGTFVTILSNYSLIMIMFYFYSISFLKRSKWFNLMIILSSLSMIIIGILGIDRSKTFYWIITYGAMIVFFWKFLNDKQRKKMKMLSIVLVSLLLVYFLATTISRFGERSSGTTGGIIGYAGQSYLNFCMFYDEVNYPDKSLQRILPLSYNLFIDNGLKSSVELNNDITLKTGKFAGIFSTFIGDILIACGKFVAILYCIIISFLSYVFLKNTSRIIYFHNLIFLFYFYSIPLLGIFVHFYSHYLRAYSVILFFIYAFYMLLKKINNNKINRYY